MVRILRRGGRRTAGTAGGKGHPLRYRGVVENVPDPERPGAVEAAAPDVGTEGAEGEAGADGAQDGAGPEDPDGAGPEGAVERDPLRFNNWMKRSATGAVMTGIAIGLREALEPRRPEVAFVIEASDPDSPDGPIDLRFDPDSPQNTVAVIRRSPPDSSGETPAD
jgi:hypothetical protein